MRKYLVLALALLAAGPARADRPRPAVTYAIAIGQEPVGDVAVRSRPCDAACRRALILPLAPPASLVVPPQRNINGARL